MNLGGKLIVIEGPDHVGRSMHARLLSERLKAHGVAVSIVGERRGGKRDGCRIAACRGSR